jgi:hypothetical protein
MLKAPGFMVSAIDTKLRSTAFNLLLSSFDMRPHIAVVVDPRGRDQPIMPRHVIDTHIEPSFPELNGIL